MIRLGSGLCLGNPHGMAKVLVIEDVPISRSLLRRVLHLAGHQVLEAEDGPGGLAAALAGEPNLILMDLSLPLLDGWSVLSRLREQGIGVPVVALTAHALVGDRERVLAAGFDGYMSKPIDVRTFHRDLESYLTCPKTR